MCTFSITNYKKILPIDKFLKLGGPNLSSNYCFDDIVFTHNLLPLTGEVTPQPIIQNDILYMLLGEVYNYDSVVFKSDIYHVIEQYKLHKDNLTNYLDGEFLIIIYDMRKGIINFYTDPWSTKMGWFDKSKDYFYFGSLKLTDKSVRLLHNSHYTFNTKTKEFKLINNSLHTWDLTQYKSNYNDWDVAFIESVKKRAHKEIALALSGGLDSAAIAACLSDLGIPFESIFLFRDDQSEDLEALKSIKYYIHSSCPTIHVINDSYKLNIESFSYKFLKQNYLNEHPTSYICSKMIHPSVNKKIMLTGQGADEIIDNYIFKDFIRRNKSLKMSTWPTELADFFPYDNFYENKQRTFIDIQQYICHAYGLEARNPFLDKKLTQEWLSLSSDLKNKESKGPIKNFLRKRQISISKKVAGLGNQDISISTSKAEYMSLF